MRKHLRKVWIYDTKSSNTEPYQDGYPQGPQPLPSLAFEGCWEGCGLVDTLAVYQNFR